jgi:hypothetical protein
MMIAARFIFPPRPRLFVPPRPPKATAFTEVIPLGKQM